MSLKADTLQQSTAQHTAQKKTQKTAPDTANQPKKREGSALTGLRVVFVKELQDFTGSARMIVLLLLIFLTASASLYTAARTIKDVVGEDPFLLLSLFTLSQDPVPSFVSFLTILVPLAGIALGFDAVNSEFQNRTMGRVLSQPIYRDVLLFGKALSAVAAMAIVLLALWLIVIGFAMLFLGIPPSSEQAARALTFYVLTLLYAGIWFFIAMLFSILFRQAATSALVSLGVWLLFTVFWPMITGVISRGLAEPGTLFQAQLQSGLGRISPNMLFSESAIAILNPSTRTLSPVVFSQLQGIVTGTPLPFGQSLLLIWPHIAGFAASIILIFTLAYVVFQRRDIQV